jgi:DinB superfamily
MEETPQQYTHRILGYLEGEEPIEVLAATPSRIARLIRGVSKNRLSVRPGPDTWSVAEILAHLADSELVYGFRIRLILEASGTPIQNIDQDAWARFSDYAKHDPLLSLEALRINRRRLLLLLKTLPRKSWDSYGMHSARGRESIKRVVEMLAGHDINHMRQIKERLRLSR